MKQHERETIMAENDINNEEQYEIAAKKLIELYKNKKEILKANYNKKTKKFNFDQIISKEIIDGVYEDFRNKFSIDKLSKFKDEDILTKLLFQNGNDNDLCHQLEFNTKELGSIRGGNVYKYGIHKDESGWILGNSENNSKLVNEQVALTKGKELLKYLIEGGKLIDNYKDKFISIENYEQFNGELKKVNKISNYIWVKKYYHMLFPEYLCNWFSENKLDTILVKLGITPLKTYYGKSGQLSLIYKKTGYNPVLCGYLCGYLCGNIFLNDEDVDDSENKEKGKKDNLKSYPLNQILYGPPGTGKTYNTVNYAVAICDGKPIDEVKKEQYSEVMKRYKELKSAGRIAFTTFHQSYGYEEFIEGIKPVLNEESNDSNVSELKYTLEKGIFRSFCENISEKASLVTLNNRKNYGFNDNPTVWKVSLFKSYDNPIREECLKNGHIRIGWEEYGPDISDETKYEIGGKSTLNAFINLMQIGDIVFSCYNQTMIDAIGVITGDYEWDNSFKDHNRVRKVNWIIKDKIDIRELNGGKNMVQSTVYRMSITVSDVKRLLTEKYPKNFIENNQTKAEPYVFIIDEINRGNISKIFGELITLIEDKKRLGNSEEMETILPYSHKPFGVPNNLYIIGTMNTSDRSIATIDIALRRRFTFKEMMPDIERVPDVEVFGIKLKEIFNKLNKRISVLLDRDHQIGHSYFMNVGSIEDLKSVWFNCVMPLLNEYFYNDWEKLKLIIPGFIRAIDIPQNLKDECDSAYEFKTVEDMKDDKSFIDALNKTEYKENE